jgi:RNA polymerase sigma-70 factor (ECF subfamily)
MDHEHLMRRFQRGDPTATRELYEMFGRAVFVVALKALGDRGLAEEAVQQTFLRAWQASNRFELGRDPGPWLYAIARRSAIDIYRRERRHRDTPGRLAAVVPLPPNLEDSWETWQIRSALDQLPKEEQEVLQATHFLGLTHVQTAEELGIPVGTVKSRSNRAHRRLQELLSHIREVPA